MTQHTQQHRLGDVQVYTQVGARTHEPFPRSGSTHGHITLCTAPLAV